MSLKLKSFSELRNWPFKYFKNFNLYILILFEINIQIKKCIIINMSFRLTNKLNTTKFMLSLFI